MSERGIATTRLIRPAPPSAHGAAVVFFGGAVGTLVRAGLVEAVPWRAGEWPWPTFIANVLGCAILGWLLTHTRVNGGARWRVGLIGTGLCGALTTFSTVQLEVYSLLDAGDAALAVVYVGASLICGLIAVLFTRRVVERGRDLA